MAPSREVIRAGVAYAVVTVALWPFPVLNILHVESAAVVAAAAFLISGITGIALFRRNRAFAGVLVRQVTLLGIPWLLLTATLLWVPNCDYLRGLGLFATFTIPGIILAVGISYFLVAAGIGRPVLAFVMGSILLALGGVVYDLGFHAQFYTYSHVFGGVLGPIYDDELSIRPGIFVFRAFTLLWALVAVGAGHVLRGGHRYWLRITALASMLLVVGYVYRAELGINSTESSVQRSLGGHHATPHFDIYFEAGSLVQEELRFIERVHEFRLAQLGRALEVTPSGRIRTYLYPDAATRARLVGARYTNVAPVWLREPQMHILEESFDRVFAHELVHILSREFGMPIIGASRLVGLVEGLAVALEPPDGAPNVHEQVVTAATVRTALMEREGRTLAGEVAARLGATGFWTGRGAVSYTTMGSFVRFLLDEYGPEPFRHVYRTGDFHAAYGRNVQDLTAEWEAYIRRIPYISRGAEALVSRRFTVPSLFEVRCPHYIPAHVRLMRSGNAAFAEGDTVRALDDLSRAITIRPEYVPARISWAAVHLAVGERPEDVIDTLKISPSTRWAAAQTTMAAAFLQMDLPDSAVVRYRNAVEMTPRYARDSRVSLWGRIYGLDASEVRTQTTNALLAFRRGQLEEAWLLLEPVLPAEGLPPARRAEIVRWQYGMRARIALRMDRSEEAGYWAGRAAVAYAVAGDLNQSQYFRDLEAMASWEEAFAGEPVGP
jgi:hypothetical protein